MPYTGTSYGEQGNGYGHTHESSWNGSNFGSTRETTRGAAEALRNMSNNSYAPSNASAGSTSTHPSVNASNAPSTRHAPASSHSPQVRAQEAHTATATYGQAQTRPRSVNTNLAQATHNRGLPSPATAAGYPSRRAQTLYNQQQPYTSPAQPQYTAIPASFARSSTLTAATYDQYNDFNHCKLSGVEATRAPQTASTANSFNYTGNHQSAPTSAPPAPNIGLEDTHSAQRATTVDPSAVYDPYVDIQRRADIARAEKAREEVARAEEERAAEEARKAEEIKAEEHRRQEEERLRQLQPKPEAKKVQKQQTSTAEGASESSETSAEDLEAAMRAMMAKMRELNSKDPAMLARIWEEERRAKAPKLPTTQDKPALQVPAPHSAPLVQPVRDVQASVPPITDAITDARKKTMPKVPVVPTMAKTAKATTPIQPPATSIRPRALPPAASNRTGGSTIWPPEKRAQLANAAISFLRVQNSTSHVEASQILTILHSNPSYVQLCEQLEQQGLKFDRAAFAKSLLTAVPDVNSESRKAAPQPAKVPVPRPAVPAAVMKSEMASPVVVSPRYTPIAASPANSGDQTPLPAAPVPVAEMVPIKAELKPPANKEEAARKRSLSDLVDLTQLSDEEELGPPMKILHSDFAHSVGSPYPHVQDSMVMDAEPATVNFPIASVPPPAQRPIPQPMLAPTSDFRNRPVVEIMDRKKALRRNNYNPATIARDVLLACGRHPSERQLNQHLDSLRTTVGILFDSDLSTIRWDLLDPGTPPPGYFKESVHDLTGDADDEDDLEDEGHARPRDVSHPIGGESGASQVQALPQAINPFKQKRRGRAPRHSLPNRTEPATPQHTTSASSMSASAPRPAPPAAGVGYKAFQSVTQYGPDGKPLPKKKGRPVGWRKAIHGSGGTLARSAPNSHTSSVNSRQPSQPNTLRTIRTGEDDPIRIESRSPSVANRAPHLQSYGCQWRGCKAELHNLETLRKHVFKVHCKETTDGTLECCWRGCGREVASHGSLTNTTLEGQKSHSFAARESDWQDHILKYHIDPMSWELGDGPASGLSGKEND